MRYRIIYKVYPPRAIKMIVQLRKLLKHVKAYRLGKDEMSVNSDEELMEVLAVLDDTCCSYHVYDQGKLVISVVRKRPAVSTVFRRYSKNKIRVSDDALVLYEFLVENRDYLKCNIYTSDNKLKISLKKIASIFGMHTSKVRFLLDTLHCAGYIQILERGKGRYYIRLLE